ncbi:recombinase family protein [Paenibacillus sp. 598K]|uniref:recombinase family protein n=1 Tax=Paenibacillus sp. 598K TaxID=1117987 RepID=UPI000FFA8E21|nr:recombinase family protein [Paenibacillus sp. 598K]GBF73226.1 recombinase family protein [Paenibacillus sp. 598K]
MLKREYLVGLGIEFILNYLRKSRQDEELEKRTKEDTLKAQKDLMDRFLEPIGIPYEQRSEIGSGDKIESRPVFQGVIRDLREKKYQAIAVKEISRMGRGSYTDMGVIYDLIQENRIFIITPYKVYDPRNPSDLRQIRFELFMSREEFETTRERLFGGRVNNAMGGMWVSGKAPFGFTYNKKTRKLEVDEEEAAVVRILFDYYVNGVPTKNGKRRDVSFRALATYLKRNTLIKTPKGKTDWHPIAIRQLITNERYNGVLRFRTTQRINGKRIARPEEEHIIRRDAVPRIISEELWHSAQEKVNESAHKPRTKMEFSPCELAGLCVCIKCGRRMIRQYSVQKYKTKEGKVSTYHKEFLWCTQPGCTFVKYRAVEEDLIATLQYFSALDNERLQDQIGKVIASNKKSQELTLSKEALSEHVNQRRKELKAREKFIYEKYESGKYTDEVFDERMAELKGELKKLEEMETAVEGVQEGEEEINVEAVRGNLESVLQQYESTNDKTEKNEILRSVFEHVVIEIIEKGRGRIPAKHMIYPVLKFNLLKSNSFGLMMV